MNKIQKLHIEVYIILYVWYFLLIWYAFLYLFIRPFALKRFREILKCNKMYTYFVFRKSGRQIPFELSACISFSRVEMADGLECEMRLDWKPFRVILGTRLKFYFALQLENSTEFVIYSS